MNLITAPHLPLLFCSLLLAAGGSSRPWSHQDRGDARKVCCWLPEWTGSQPLCPMGKDHLIVCRCADSPGGPEQCFTQVLLSTLYLWAISLQGAWCGTTALAAPEWKRKQAVSALGARRSLGDTPDLWLPSPAEGNEPPKRWRRCWAPAGSLSDIILHQWRKLLIRKVKAISPRSQSWKAARLGHTPRSASLPGLLFCGLVLFLTAPTQRKRICSFFGGGGGSWLLPKPGPAPVQDDFTTSSACWQLKGPLASISAVTVSRHAGRGGGGNSFKNEYMHVSLLLITGMHFQER